MNHTKYVEKMADKTRHIVAKYEKSIGETPSGLTLTTTGSGFLVSYTTNIGSKPELLEYAGRTGMSAESVADIIAMMKW